MLSRLTLALLVLVLAATLGMGSLDRVADGELRRQVAQRGLASFVDYGQLALDLPRAVTIRDISMTDPLDGRLIGELDELIFELVYDPDAEPTLALGPVRGKGARIVLVPDGSAYSLGIVRGLDRLVGAINDLIDELKGPAVPGELPMDMPPLEFRDIDLSVRSQSLPIEHYPGSSVIIDDDAETREFVIAHIFIGDDLGELTLFFHQEEGLVRIAARDLVVTTAITMAIPEPWGTLLARTFRPDGRIDFVLDGLAEGQNLSLRGELHDAVLRPGALSLPLGPATFPFAMRDGHLRVERVSLPYAGGTLELSAEGSAEVVDVRVSVRGADLSGAIAALLPAGTGAASSDAPLRVSDEGRFDADLVLQGSLARGLAVVSGSGGFHVARLDLAEPALAIDDVVGRFAVADDVVTIDRLSGLLAGGGARGRATLDLVERTFTGELEVLDIDIARLRPRGRDGATGWLQGQVALAGRFDALGDVAIEGDLSIRAGRFADAPLVVELASALTRFLGRDSRPRDEQRVAVRFQGVGDTFQLEKVRLDLGALVLAGTGRLEGDRRLSLDLYLFSREGLLSQIVSLVGEALVQVVVRGTLQNPRVDVYLGAVLTRPLVAILESLTSWD